MNFVRQFLPFCLGIVEVIDREVGRAPTVARKQGAQSFRQRRFPRSLGAVDAN
jgi:hypothetical protein